MTGKTSIAKTVLIVKLEALFRTADPADIDEAVAEAKALASVKPRPISPEFQKQMDSEVGIWPLDRSTPFEQLEKDEKKAKNEGNT